MEITALVLGLFGFLIALKVRGEFEILREQLDRTPSGGGGGSEGLADLERELAALRAQVARLAAGESLDPEAVAEGRTWSDVDTARAMELLEAGVRVLDVRTPGETAGGVIPGATLIPVNELPERVGELEARRREPLLVCCAAGVRSAAACDYLADQGFPVLYNLANGMMGWSGPVERPS
jgi:rhodanese-related sulfurtransferase